MDKQTEFSLVGSTLVRGRVKGILHRKVEIMKDCRSPPFEVNEYRCEKAEAPSEWMVVTVIVVGVGGGGDRSREMVEVREVAL